MKQQQKNWHEYVAGFGIVDRKRYSSNILCGWKIFEYCQQAEHGLRAVKKASYIKILNAVKLFLVY